MNPYTSEQNLRREAIRRRLAQEHRKDICHDLQRSTSWFDKWWAEFRRNPHTDLADHSRAPHTSPHQTPVTVVQMIVSIRKVLEAAATPETQYGLIGPRTIQEQLERLAIAPPSLATIERILHAHDLTHPWGASNGSAYYPWLTPWEVNAIHATDILTRHVHGGEEIQNLHTIDQYSHAVYLSQYTEKSSAIISAHLVATWSKLGLPQIEQLDNEGAFSGGHTHPRVLGQVVRLCLFCGIEPLFIPVYEAKRNYHIESFHSLWVRGFWSRQEFRNRAHVQAESPRFERWYHTVYRPPALQGRTVAQMRRGVTMVRLTADMRRLIPMGRLPITAGRIHFMRKVDGTGEIKLLNETWLVGRKWVGEYVRATIQTDQQTLTFWHKADAESDWRHIKTRQLRLKETVCPVLPTFRRNRTQCREYLPG